MEQKTQLQAAQELKEKIGYWKGHLDRGNIGLESFNLIMTPYLAEAKANLEGLSKCWDCHDGFYALCDNCLAKEIYEEILK